jgi:hypothetical protein
MSFRGSRGTPAPGPPRAGGLKPILRFFFPDQMLDGIHS